MDQMEDYSLRRGVFWTVLLILFNSTPSNQECTVGKPIVDPPSLVVKYGDPASATCSTPFHVDVMGWNASVGAATENTQLLVWTVPSVTDWSLGRGITCVTSSEEHGRCQTHLPITIYKIPARVTLELLYPPVPLIGGRVYTFYCTVHSVAPHANVTVRWTEGDRAWTNTEVVSKEGDELATVKYRQRIRASRETHGVSYSCAAHLDLNTAEPVPDTRSNTIQLEVLYKPIVVNASEDVSLKPDGRLDLICEGESNPSPSYLWKHNGAVLAHANKTTLSIESVSGSHAGVYECVISNREGDVTVSIKVDVEVPSVPPSPVVGVSAAIAALVLVGAGIGGYWLHRRRTKTDCYQLR
ncbi:cell adhesion molecule 3-like [Sardina pilchardus]|uniref:cell adhesion molecule 3-like n=1 Tax=Sardina pilchardus TaxID=27697 RepID=UPI002E0DE343